MDRAQENLHFVMDICDAMLYILETDDNIEVLRLIDKFVIKIYRVSSYRIKTVS